MAGMTRVLDADWRAWAESPRDMLRFLIGHKVRFYFQVPEDSYALFRTFTRHVGQGQQRLPMPFSGFKEGVQFVALSDQNLEAMLVSSQCMVSRFTNGAWALPGRDDPRIKARNSGAGRVATVHVGPLDADKFDSWLRFPPQERPAIQGQVQPEAQEMVQERLQDDAQQDVNPERGPAVGAQCVTHPALEWVDFESACLVSRDEWVRVRDFHPPLTAPGPSDLARQFEIRIDQLFVEERELQRARQGVSGKEGLHPYPFEHELSIPGVYWMFQAAYLHNSAKALERKDIVKWLRAHAPKDTFAVVMRSAKNFVRLDLHRGKGSGARGPAAVEALDDASYYFDFASPWLSLILYAADWWEELRSRGEPATPAELAARLVQQGFNGLEVGDLTYLITRRWIRKGEVDGIYRSAKFEGKKRPLVDSRRV